MSDEVVTKIFNERLENHLDSVNGKIVCCSHHVPFKELQTAIKHGGRAYSFFNAYGGSAEFGRILRRYKVGYSLSGHLHTNTHMMLYGVECYQTSIGYLGTDYCFGTKPRYDEIIEERTLTLNLP